MIHDVLYTYTGRKLTGSNTIDSADSGSAGVIGDGGSSTGIGSFMTMRLILSAQTLVVEIMRLLMTRGLRYGFSTFHLNWIFSSKAL